MQVHVLCSKYMEDILREFYLPSVPSSWVVTRHDLPDEIVFASELEFQNKLARWGCNWIADTLEAHPGECCLFTGCDQFYRGDCEQDLIERLGDADMCCPLDGKFFCGDFRYVRSTPHTIRVFRAWPQRKPTEGEYWWTSNPELNIVALPKDLYWGTWAEASGHWEPDFPAPVPPKTALWIHGNGAKLEHKAALLKHYRACLTTRYRGFETGIEVTSLHPDVRFAEGVLSQRFHEPVKAVAYA